MSKYTALQEQTMDEVRERYKEGGYNNKYFTDEIHEIVDGNIPVYNTELLEEVKYYDKLSDNGLLPQNPDIYDFARVTIYEGLCEVAYEAFNEVEHEYEEMIEELDNFLEACEDAQEDYDNADDEDEDDKQEFSEILADAESELEHAIKEYENEGWEIPQKYVRG